MIKWLLIGAAFAAGVAIAIYYIATRGGAAMLTAPLRSDIANGVNYSASQYHEDLHTAEG